MTTARTAVGAPLVGHAAVVSRLQRSRVAGGLSHAILLSGPDGIGKTTVAEALAADLLEAGGWPGGLRAHPDHWLEDSDAERIGIDRVRYGGGDDASGPSLQEFLSLVPYAGGRRAAVIGRADRLTEAAANCVLKTLEEPPAQTHIVLCAAHPERLPATILSRCQVSALAPVPSADIAGWLRDSHAVAGPLAGIAAALGGGRPGRALALATTPGALHAELAAIDALLVAAGSGRGGALRAAGAVAPPASTEGRERALTVVAAWTSFVRDVACHASGVPELALWEHYAPAAAAWASALTEARLDLLLGRLVETSDQLAQYAVPRLCFEVLLLDILTGRPAPPRFTPPPHPAGLPEGGGAAPASTPRSRRPQRRR